MSWLASGENLCRQENVRNLAVQRAGHLRCTKSGNAALRPRSRSNVTGSTLAGQVTALPLHPGES